MSNDPPKYKYQNDTKKRVKSRINTYLQQFHWTHKRLPKKRELESELHTCWKTAKPYLDEFRAMIELVKRETTYKGLVTSTTEKEKKGKFDPITSNLNLINSSNLNNRTPPISVSTSSISSLERGLTDINTETIFNKHHKDMYLLTLNIPGNTINALHSTASNSSLIVSSFMDKLNNLFGYTLDYLFRWELTNTGFWHLHIFVPFKEIIPLNSFLFESWFEVLDNIETLTGTHPLESTYNTLTRFSGDAKAYLVKLLPYELRPKGKNKNYYLSKNRPKPLRVHPVHGIIKPEAWMGCVL